MLVERMVSNREALRGLLMGVNDRRWEPKKPAKPTRTPRAQEAARRAAAKAAEAVARWRP